MGALEILFIIIIINIAKSIVHSPVGIIYIYNFVVVVVVVVVGVCLISPRCEQT